MSKARIPLRFASLTSALLIAMACDPIEDGGGGNDGGPGNGGMCPSALPEATVSTSSATLDADTGNQWTVVTWATSEVATGSENTEVTYGRAASGGLTAIQSRPRLRNDSKMLRDLVYTKARVERLEHEHTLRSYRPSAPYDPSALHGTAIRGRTRDLLPEDARLQNMACDETNPSVCGASMLCVIPEGMTAGTCESALTLKFQGTDVPATVRQVGSLVAVVVADADAASVSDEDVATLVERFDTHIGPRDHQFFGEPTANGRDRDGNGVVIMFLTNMVSQAGDSVVGFFLPADLETTAMNANSNAADLLYLRPPSATITLDALSGTMAHEYQHLINYYSKVTRNQSEQEERWLDEGLATFAEDINGYGGDSFKNVFAYLQNASDTSLTGFGLIASDENEADGFERRGFAHLMVRYVYERAGGATFPDGPGAVTDSGGVAAIRAMVDTDDTGIDALTTGGRDFKQLMSGLLMTIAIDGTALACLPDFDFAEPQTDAYTGFQRGFDLRTSVSIPGGMTINFNGPATNNLAAESVPFPINGGEFRTVSVDSGSVGVSAAASMNNAEVGFRAYAQ